MSLIRVGRVEVWRKVGGTNFLFFFLLVSIGQKEEGTTPFCQTKSAVKDREQTFDDALETLM